VKARLVRLLLPVTVVLAIALPMAAAVAQPAPGDGDAVVPAGQEELLADMLGKGATLPGGCQLADGRVEYATVTAKYTCPNGEVVFELSHPSRAGGGAMETDRFALTPKSGSPPPELAPELVARIRAREAGFEWKWLGGPPKARSRALPFAVAGLLAIAVLGWVLRSRSSARRADSP
jgi:hypothetical protein